MAPMADAQTYSLTSGKYRADIAAVGAGLRVLEYDGAPLTETWEAGSKPPLSAGLVLAPWPNRTADGTFTFEGVEHRLEITEPSRGNASHGFVRRVAWTLVEHTDSRVEQSVDIGTHEGWPFSVTVTVVHELSADGLTVTASAKNTGDSPAPYGMGFHTFVRVGDAPLDECTLELSAGTRLPLDPVRNLPVGNSVPTADTEYDFRQPRTLQGVQLDTPFSASLPEADGRANHVLRGPDGTATVLWTDSSFGWVQVFTADPANDQAYPGRGRALAIEPMTCPPDALNSEIDLIVLDPGQSWSGTWGMRYEK
ncbi:aldose epimerase [Rhodococcus sp. 05-340-1]|uniref:aldose 1-epimerase family protein n=1 Tax=unclassified Rhodococcus (in: high G+C Gram-positive bacteria) TaxID=192944 RepID=UPI000B9B0361|nr:MULTISPECIES: aldose 1-epimerase family protein [unclassified Rhodococcus (in: high G+C Gram-positive bacteria)]OZD71360.1 aldose epimerase [Rhodococcus sp. 05-340-2]OZD83145.1 aldose epimerase [Rhodococcus sp. 05-340-1]